MAGVRRRREGRNRLPRAQRPSLVRLLFREATHFFALMLGGDAAGGVPVPAPLSGVLGGAWPGPV
ncbi:MAG TPA: cation-transporting P-type ATPase, partial [Micromonosporaceae bacterium]|nr:cation-transporting P-type ATPase [Micromonosporaceae bacterium]